MLYLTFSHPKRTVPGPAGILLKNSLQNSKCQMVLFSESSCYYSLFCKKYFISDAILETIGLGLKEDSKNDCFTLEGIFLEL